MNKKGVDPEIKLEHCNIFAIVTQNDWCSFFLPRVPGWNLSRLSINTNYVIKLWIFAVNTFLTLKTSSTPVSQLQCKTKSFSESAHYDQRLDIRLQTGLELEGTGWWFMMS